MAWKRDHACSDFASISKPKISLYLLVRPCCSTSRSFCMWYCSLGLRNSLSNVNLLISLFWRCSSDKLFLLLSTFMSLPYSGPLLFLLHRRFVPRGGHAVPQKWFLWPLHKELQNWDASFNQHSANNTMEKLNTYPLGAGDGWGVAVLRKCLMN